tara:strand:+ start:864 stop:1067 length:204 start_codon:yes stop_codon:yes gene_type:complete
MDGEFKMIKTYTIHWEVELDASSHKEAAEKARNMQLNVYSTATFFDVTCVDKEGDEVEIGIDLEEWV